MVTNVSRQWFRGRVERLTVVLTVVVSSILVTDKLQAGGPNRIELLQKDAYASIGGTTQLSALRGLHLRGVTSDVLNRFTGALTPPHSVEFYILFPDNFLRLDNDRITIRRAGFSGAMLLNRREPLRPEFEVGGQVPPGDLKTERGNYARLMVGILAGFPGAMPPGVRAVELVGPDTIQFAADDGRPMFLDLDATSRVPIRIRYDDYVSRPQINAPRGQRLMIAPPPKSETTELSIVFEERRWVGGLALPHRIRRLAANVTLEDMRFETITTNPPLGHSDFRQR